MTAETVYGFSKLEAKLSPSNIAVFAPGRDAPHVRCLMPPCGASRRDAKFPPHRPRRPGGAGASKRRGNVPTAFLSRRVRSYCDAPLNPAFSAGEFDSALQDLRIGAVIVQVSTESPVREVTENRNCTPDSRTFLQY